MMRVRKFESRRTAESEDHKKPCSKGELRTDNEDSRFIVSLDKYFSEFLWCH